MGCCWCGYGNRYWRMVFLLTFDVWLPRTFSSGGQCEKVAWIRSALCEISGWTGVLMKRQSQGQKMVGSSALGYADVRLATALYKVFPNVISNTLKWKFLVSA